MTTPPNLLDDKALFVLALQFGPIAGDLFYSLRDFSKRNWPNASAIYLHNLEYAQNELMFSNLTPPETLRADYIFEIYIITGNEKLKATISASKHHHFQLTEMEALFV